MLSYDIRLQLFNYLIIYKLPITERQLIANNNTNVRKNTKK